MYVLSQQLNQKRRDENHAKKKECVRSYEKSLQKAVLLKSGLLKRKMHVKTESNPQALIQVLIKRKLTQKKPSQSAHKEIRENYLTYVTSVHLS